MAVWNEGLDYLILAGPTASGKSALALWLVNAFERERPIEIVSADSALVYCGLDIGTAKPSIAERAQAVHHLIDIREPHQAYNAADFVRDCRSLITDIHARGAFPLIVGGTMLYIHALLNGLDELPAADTAIREQIDSRANQHGWPAVHEWLVQLDPVTAARLAINDKQRIQRALEVCLITGRPLSELHRRQNQTSAQRQTLTDWIARHVISLEPLQRSWLHKRIEQRFELMMQQGFLEEVQRLRRDERLQADLPAIRSVGYRQAWQALAGAFPMIELCPRAVAATRQLAKRQLTWLRGMPSRLVLPCDDVSIGGEKQLREQAQSILRSILRDNV